MADLVQYYGTGRRKSAIARVFHSAPAAAATSRSTARGYDEVLRHRRAARSAAKQPLVLTEHTATFDVVTTVRGGGVSGQADAVKMGIARALLEFNIELRKTLKTPTACSPATLALRKS